MGRKISRSQGMGRSEPPEQAQAGDLEPADFAESTTFPRGVRILTSGSRTHVGGLPAARVRFGCRQHAIPSSTCMTARTCSTRRRRPSASPGTPPHRRPTNRRRDHPTALMVGVYNTPDRISEYTWIHGGRDGGGKGRLYGQFLFEEVKPFIDAELSTRLRIARIPASADRRWAGSSR